MKKNNVEKALKRFLKRKIGYSLSLLVVFMITGEISLATGITTEEIQENKNELLKKIQIANRKRRNKKEGNRKWKVNKKI